MKSRGFLFGSAMVIAIVAFAALAFVQTARPVQAGPVGSMSRAAICPTGATGMPSTCAEVHASALAAGTMTRSQFNYAQTRLEALSAHAHELPASQAQPQGTL
jgi:hypothetical protein